MRIEHLREFLELAYCLNFTRAAKKLQMTQSGLSKHIQLLESELNVVLFDRSGQRIELTEAGRLLFQEASALVEAHDGVVRKMRSLGHRANCVTVGGMVYNPTVAAWADKAVAALDCSGEEISLVFRNAVTRPLQEALESGEVDAIFTMLDAGQPMASSLEVVPLFRDPLVCVVAQGHPLAARSTISCRDLCEWTLIKPMGTYQILGNAAISSLLTTHEIISSTRVVFLESITDFHTIEFGRDVLLMEKTLAQSRRFPEGYTVLDFSDEGMALTVSALFRADERDPAIITFHDALAQLAHEGARL